MAFIAHPSVRILGTENIYSPISCIDPNCPNKNPHMHCPLCVKTDNYHDPVILKAHYRVKHVDKGLAFAGLRILQCCDSCEIVGAINGKKRFKGAHWHCYRCRNGFNRRDEAIKHYRTHFRNPQTTFQIQITQEVNQMFHMPEQDSAPNHIPGEMADISIMHMYPAHQNVAETGTTSAQSHTSILNNENDPSLANGRPSEGAGDAAVAVGVNETLPEGHQTIMLIAEEECLDGSEYSQTAYGSNQVPQGEELISPEVFNRVVSQKVKLERKLEAMQVKYNQLEGEKLRVETQLNQEVDDLKMKVVSYLFSI
ncbi:PREDICTED: uncharacterized protein LOC106807193 [Priapulus caudatus]|uniref:Uncharacterized protein LOC106807193 n=1 Tax=Priapulus caudatus TaxID=37621 RepID=A0ABM1DYD3_PRICU|nr:PREDICTED: uncharacterized protein LOC106807193 [Priapulus caudatus]